MMHVFASSRPYNVDVQEHGNCMKEVDKNKIKMPSDNYYNGADHDKHSFHGWVVFRALIPSHRKAGSRETLVSRDAGPCLLLLPRNTELLAARSPAS